MKYYSIFFIVIWCAAGHAQPIFKKSFHPSYISDKVFELNGYLYLSGINNFSQRKAIILKSDFNGGAQWATEISSHCNEFNINDMVSAPDGNIYIVGNALDSEITCNSNILPMLLKINSTTGQLIQSYAISAHGSGSFSSIITDANGNLIIAGNDYYSGNYYSRGVLIKMDTSLNVLWQYEYDNGLSNLYWTDIQQNLSGDFFISGYRTDTGLTKRVVAKIDSSGNIIWSKLYDDTHASAGIQVVLQNNDILITSNYEHSLTSFNSTAILKIDTGGNILWYKLFQGPAAGFSGLLHAFNSHYLIASALLCIIDSNANVIKTGKGFIYGRNFGIDSNLNVYTIGYPEFSIHKCDSNLICCEGKSDTIWTVLFNNIWSVNFQLSQLSHSPAVINYFSSAALILSDSLHCGTSAAISSTDLISKDIQVFPNPSNGRFLIKSLEKMRIDQIKIFNAMGMEVSNLIYVIEEQQHYYVVNTEKLIAGLYWLRYKTETFPLILY